MTDIDDSPDGHEACRPVTEGSWRIGLDIAPEKELIAPEQATEEGRPGATAISGQTVFKPGGKEKEYEQNTL